MDSPNPNEQGPYYPMKKKDPKLLGGRLAELKNFHRTKSNSTSTLYVSSTVSQPDLDQLLKCVALTIQQHIEEDQAVEQKLYFDIFDEIAHPLNNEDEIDVDSPPTVADVYEFIDVIFKAERLSPECAIMMLAYIERVKTSTKMTIDATNWRRVILSTLILASKVWEDQAVWNVDFLSVFPNVDVKDLGNLEKFLLRLIQYNVSLAASLYAKYYFELRSIAERNATTFPMKPLDKDGAKHLEARSQSEEEKMREKYQKERVVRSKSLSEMDDPRSPPVILN